MNFKFGFTIWELLCIIIVILLLLGLLMPALNRVRRVSTRIVCASTLSHYGLAGLMYLNDNDEKFPAEENEWLYTKDSFNMSHPSGCRWHDKSMAPGQLNTKSLQQFRGNMWQYIGDFANNSCPQFRNVAASRGCENPEHPENLTINPQYNYTMNGYLGTPKPGGVFKKDEVSKPSEIFFFAEENSWTLRPDHPRFPAKWLTKAVSTKALDDTMLSISSTSQAEDCFATYHDAPMGDRSWFRQYSFHRCTCGSNYSERTT